MAGSTTPAETTPVRPRTPETATPHSQTRGTSRPCLLARGRGARTGWLRCRTGRRDSSQSISGLPNRDLTTLDVDVLDPQLKGFLQPQPCPLQQRHDEPGSAVETRQDPRHLSSSQDHRQPTRRARPHDALHRANFPGQDGPVEKQHGAERLILRGRAHALPHGQVRKKRGNRAATRTRGSAGTRDP